MACWRDVKQPTNKQTHSGFVDWYWLKKAMEHMQVNEQVRYRKTAEIKTKTKRKRNNNNKNTNKKDGGTVKETRHWQGEGRVKLLRKRIGKGNLGLSS